LYFNCNQALSDFVFDGDGASDSQDGRTALIYAAQYGRTDCVRLLIDAGADKEARNNVRVGRCQCFGEAG
jgi:hypothetical protein